MINSRNPNVEFTTFDRCDRCGSQAYVSARKGRLELLFCLHHGKQHNLALEMDGWTMGYDYSAIDGLADNERVSV